MFGPWQGCSTLDTWYNPSKTHMTFPVLLSHPSSFRGASATGFLEWLTPSSLSTLASHSSTLSVFLNERGGIIDDTIITKYSNDAYYVVTNAARRDRDIGWFRCRLKEWNSSERAKAGGVELDVLQTWGLLALQGWNFFDWIESVPIACKFWNIGPESAAYLQSLTSFDLNCLTFGNSAIISLKGFDVHVSRGGYTGEDGFEVNFTS
jgi:aminomethyltransferase